MKGGNVDTNTTGWYAAISTIDQIVSRLSWLDRAYLLNGSS